MRVGGRSALALVLTLAAGAALAACSRDPEDHRNARVVDSIRPAPAHGGAAAPAGTLRFTPPSGWVTETPTSSMRRAQYRLARADGDPEDGELVVFYFEGQGGSIQANIDRWTGQFQKSDGTSASGDARVSNKQTHGIPLTIVDCSGTYTGGGGPMASGPPKANFRMLAAVAETPAGPWFFKLTGPARTVARWEASFQGFLDTIQ